MKKFIRNSLLTITMLIGGFILISPAYSNNEVIVPTTIMCLQPAEMTEFIDSYGEEPVWIGSTSRMVNGQEINGVASFHVNSETGTWTYIEHYSDLSCMAGAGENSKFLLDKILGGDPV